MLTQRQKVAVRRHLGVPFAGTAQAGRLYGWRFTWYNEDLEYRMNNMQPPEEQLLTGKSLGSFGIYGSPTVGDHLVFNLTDSLTPPNTLTASYDVQESDFALPPNPVNPADSSPLYSIALNSSIAINAVMSAAGYQGVGVMPGDLFAPAYTPPPFAEILITGPNPSFFTLSTSGTTGTTNLQVEEQGEPSPTTATVPATPTQAAKTLYGYIEICDYLALGFTQVELSTWLTKADVVDFRKDELVARRMRYLEACFQLESAIGGAEYVQKFGGNAMGGGGGGAVA